MTLHQIKQAIAAYFELPGGVSDLQVAGQDLGLLALNQVRRDAELKFDFEFQRRLASLTVDGATGGSLDDALLRGTDIPVDIKSIIDVGLFDKNDNMRPVDWTTISESLERDRLDNRMMVPRYPTDAWFESTPCGTDRFVIANNRILHWPRSATAGTTFDLGFEVYAFTETWSNDEVSLTVTGFDDTTLNGTYIQFNDYNNYPLYLKIDPGNPVIAVWHDDTPQWLISDVDDVGGTPTDVATLAGDQMSPRGDYAGTGAFSGAPNVGTNVPGLSDPWTTYGYQFLQWKAIVHLNHIFKHFVFRQEGNLPPPQALADEGLQSLIAWDANRFEQNRRHGR